MFSKETDSAPDTHEVNGFGQQLPDIEITEEKVQMKVKQLNKSKAARQDIMYITSKY